MLELPITVKVLPLIAAGMIYLSSWIMPIGPAWYQGEIHGYTWEGKVYDTPSKMGINNGRVSKISVKKNGKEVAHYDRGWDHKPETPEDEKALNDILEQITKGGK
jgi:hypothetical protein